MVKVKLKIPIFNDKVQNVTRKKGDIWETTEERAKYLENFPYQGTTIQVVEILEVKPEEKAVEEVEKPKRTRRKIDKKTK